jgi:hypothetical protein
VLLVDTGPLVALGDRDDQIIADRRFADLDTAG